MRILLLTLLAVFAAFMQSANAQEPQFDYTSFGKLPVMEDGRLKPLDSFARHQMRAVSGSESPQGVDAKVWLARILFDPASVQDTPFFTIRSAAIKRQLGLDDDQKKFSLADLQSGLAATAEDVQVYLQQETDSQTPEQNQLTQLHQSAALLTRLTQGVSLILPLSAEIPDDYKDAVPEDDYNYLTISAIETSVLERLRGIIRDKGEDPNNYSEEERKIALLSFQIEALRSGGGDGNYFKIMPGSWGSDNGAPREWFSPWHLVFSGEGGPDTAQYLDLWTDMAKAYRAQDAAKWNKVTSQTLEYIQAQELYDPARLQAESYYTLIQPYMMARIFYGLSVLSLLVFWIRGEAIWAGFARGSTLAAIGFHVFGIAARVFILARPPVGTLYESVLFVALICAILGLMLCSGKRAPYAHLGGAASALGLLFLAPFIQGEKDSLGVLVAVLNTNFWLATHVLIITAGYGVCVLAAALAHFYLGLRITRPKQDKTALALFNVTYKISVLALLLTAVGTVLGGIWADQSWGRFWGWDPKENGALLIVLWLIWAQHGRQGGHLRDVPFMAALAALNIIVAVAWFGVNLLNVGLHSYGFIQGVAIGLGSFCAAEILIIAGLWIAVRIAEKRKKEHVA